MQGERAAVAEDVHKLRQLPLRDQRNHMPSHLFQIPLWGGMLLLRDDMSTQQCGNNRSGPLLCGLADGLQALDLGFGAQAIAGLCFDRRSSLRSHLFQYFQGSLGERAAAGVADAIYARADSAASSRNLFVSGSGDAFFEVHQPRSGEDQMSMRVNEARKDD